MSTPPEQTFSTTSRCWIRIERRSETAVCDAVGYGCQVLAYLEPHTGCFAGRFEVPGHPWSVVYAVAKPEPRLLSYYSQTGVLSLQEWPAHEQRRTLLPLQDLLSVEGCLRIIRAGPADPSPQVSSGEREGRACVELTAPPSASRNAGLGPASMTLFIDPITKRVEEVRIRQFVPGETQIAEATYTIAYDQPPVAGIHELGVPQGLPIEDLRPPKEAWPLLDRLDHRVVHGIGDGVIVRLSWGLDDEGKPTGGERRIMIAAQEGDRFLNLRYSLAPDAAPSQSQGGRASVQDLPAWPDLSLEQVLDAIREAVPDNLVTSDGSRLWVGHFDKDKGRLTGQGDGMEILDASHRAQVTSIWRSYHSGGAWVGRRWFGGQAGSVYRVLHDPQRPGVVGLTKHRAPPPPGTDGPPQYSIAGWFDTTRDDLPLSFELDGQLCSGEPGGERVDYLDPVELPNGRWFYRRTLDWQKSGTEVKRRETRCILALDAKLPPSWFGDPALRFPQVVG
ncbi:MAG: hypothetical protein NTW19_08425 [Planctomycetota bacterium]|nr:hypothetical protein [Planctomycetota bacterium]